MCKGNHIKTERVDDFDRQLFRRKYFCTATQDSLPPYNTNFNATKEKIANEHKQARLSKVESSKGALLLENAQESAVVNEYSSENNAVPKSAHMLI